MKRKAKKFDLGIISTDFINLSSQKVELYCDDKVYNDIISFLSEKDINGYLIRKDRFRNILIEIFSFRYNKELYDKPKISNKSKDVTVMKFKRHRGSNWRILCKEFISKGKKIVMIILFDKKTQEISKKQKKQMETIGAYEYELK